MLLLDSHFSKQFIISFWGLCVSSVKVVKVKANGSANKEGVIIGRCDQLTFSWIVHDDSGWTFGLLDKIPVKKKKEQEP